MTYNSLFDEIAKARFERGFSYQEYQGTLDAVLTETGEALSLKDNEKGTIRLALHPPRIIRALVDYKIQNPTAPESESLLRDAICLGLDIYKGNPNLSREIEGLREKIIETGNKSLLDKVLKQKKDRITWSATHPIGSKATAENLIRYVNGAPIFFVALAHGGVASGMDTYLRYCDETGKDESGFYVTRFSIHNLDDVYPQLSPTEISYLQEQSQEKRIVIFDEDSLSGKTLKIAKQFFYKNVFPNKNMIVVANLNVNK